MRVSCSVQWWAAWYPGAEPGGGGYVAQRISQRAPSGTACSPRSSSRSRTTRSVPGRGSSPGSRTVILYPTPRRTRRPGYVQAFVDLLPTPWRGFMLAGFAAAYMSHGGHAAELGRLLSRSTTSTSDFVKTDGTEQPLRGGVTRGDGAPLPRLHRRHLAALERREGRGSCSSRSGAGTGTRAHPALVLVAHQRVERDLRDDRQLRGEHPGLPLRRRRASPRTIRTRTAADDADDGGGEHRGVGGA